MKRRDFLRLGLAAAAAPALGQTPTPSAIVPRVNGGINVQPVRRLDPGAGLTPPLIVPELVDAQMQAVYELGFEQVRITISFDRFGPDFLAAIPYVRAARALGVDVVGVIGQFTGLDLVQALSRPDTREDVLEVYFQIFDDFVPRASQAVPRAGAFSAQILNEPTHFLGIAPDTYVREYLRLAYEHLKEDDPSMIIVSAATIGSAEGVLRLRRMIEAGLELHCDRVAFHLYNERFVSELARLTEKPVWITESGVGGTDRHLAWMTETFDRLRRDVARLERIFWFDLFDFEPGIFRLVDLREELDGSFSPVPESLDAVAFLRRNVEEALAGAPPLPYRELVPDISLYLPTDEDMRVIRSTSIGSRTWG
jgi:hypothetical protein